MRVIHSLLISLAVGGVLTACDRRDAAENQPAPEPSSTPSADAARSDSAPNNSASAGDETAPTADDALALGLLGAVNEHEIAAARQAEGKGVSAPVMEFAKMMETQHGENQAKTKSLGALAETDEVKAMKDKGAKELADLGQKSGKDYEKAYVDAMVKGHAEALTLIDTRLLTLASSEPVKAHMTQTRDHVAAHLEAAKKLQKP